MTMFIRSGACSVLAALAIGWLAPAPWAVAADAFVLHQRLPTLRSLAAHAPATAAKPAESLGTEPICDIFANGCESPGASPCEGCFDSSIDFDETDVDCGGAYCRACEDGKQCLVNNDCSSGLCNASLLCEPTTCADMMKDGNETDVDCGGGACAACATGKQCTVNADCQSGSCSNSHCTDVVLISQVQTRGDNGSSDEFVELYNPTGVPVTFDSSWTFQARSATGGLATCASTSPATRFSGSGQVIPAHGHLLYVNSTGFNTMIMSDGSYTVGITDAASVVLQHNMTAVDALCFYYDATTLDALTGCPTAYVCEGMPIANAHDNTAGTNTDASLERKPGGANGNAQDTNDNAVDFFINSTPDPHNSGG